MIQEATARIRQMEQYFDLLQNIADFNPDALRDDLSIRTILQIVIQYYESGQWLRDYALDEQGLLPDNLKRGILAQDSVYDFLYRIREQLP